MLDAMSRRVFPVLLLLAGLAYSSHAVADVSAKTKTITERIAGMRHQDGLFPLDYDAETGKLYLTVRKLDEDFLLIGSLPYGLGSNDIGLDRGKLIARHLVHFTRSGPRVLLVEPNLDYRSTAANPAERLAVRQSFAESVLAAFPIEAEENGALLIDITGYATADDLNIAEQLKAAKQGGYRLDDKRTTVLADDLKDFPRNTEITSLLTFATDEVSPRSLIATVTPDAHAVTLQQQLSFIELPGPGYQPRAFDPRAGYFPAQYRDYSAPLGASLDVRNINRHRLIKKDPSAALSEPVEPIVYYVDRGAPEPIRTALVEGASWWAQAFEAAGFRNAFRVEVLPEDVDPMDVRYNMIQWVHRSTRGWSYGDSITDPRTGEIIKGQVTLGSLRARQDYLIAEALLAPYDGKTPPTEIEQMVAARIRQLAAHEVGHTLGLAHNFAASAIAPGTSVMDYPHPVVTLDGSGRPDLSHAYATSIGAWDKAAITYGYAQFAPGSDEHAALDSILNNAQQQGLYFITDEDSRPLGSVHPYAHLWDNGSDPVTELDRILVIRKAALARFGEAAIPRGTPMSQLEDTLVPLYLLHRYQTEAAAKSIAGLNYRYALRGDGQQITAPISAADQRRALTAVLATLSPDTLTLPDSLLKLLPPRAPAYDRTRESFPGRSGLAFDRVGAAESAADLTLTLLFEPTRATRLAQQNGPDALGLAETIDRTLSATWKAPAASAGSRAIQHAVEALTLEHLLGLAANQEVSAEARAIARQRAIGLRTWLEHRPAEPGEQADAAVRQAAIARIASFERDPDKFTPAPSPPAPPGMPIGDDEQDDAVMR
jgi:Met-zincin/Domain of unknown function (DUF5117)